VLLRTKNEELKRKVKELERKIKELKTGPEKQEKHAQIKPEGEGNSLSM